jgi:1,4-alpha-glucan branching enzyme
METENMTSILAEAGRKRRTSHLVATPAISPNQTTGDAAAGAIPNLNEQKAYASAAPGPKPGFKHITFQRFFPDAKQVCIAGSFNGWQPSATPMQPFGLGAGQRKAELLLKPGRYEYRFVVDGTWTDDPCSSAFIANPYGSRNCVLVVNATDNADQNTARTNPSAVAAPLTKTSP